jgi:hypothetical protein
MMMMMRPTLSSFCSSNFSTFHGVLCVCCVLCVVCCSVCVVMLSRAANVLVANSPHGPQAHL